MNESTEQQDNISFFEHAEERKFAPLFFISTSVLIGDTIFVIGEPQPSNQADNSELGCYVFRFQLTTKTWYSVNFFEKIPTKSILAPRLFLHNEFNAFSPKSQTPDMKEVEKEHTNKSLDLLLKKKKGKKETFPTSGFASLSSAVWNCEDGSTKIIIYGFSKNKREVQIWSYKPNLQLPNHTPQPTEWKLLYNEDPNIQEVENRLVSTNTMHSTVILRNRYLIPFGAYENMIPTKILEYSNACYFLKEQHNFEKEIRQKKRVRVNDFQMFNNDIDRSTLPLFEANVEIPKEGEPPRTFLRGKFQKRPKLVLEKLYQSIGRDYDVENIQKGKKKSKLLGKSKKDKKKKNKKMEDEEEILEEVETILAPSIFVFDLIDCKWIEVDCNYFLEPREGHSMMSVNESHAVLFGGRKVTVYKHQMRFFNEIWVLELVEKLKTEKFTTLYGIWKKVNTADEANPRFQHCCVAYGPPVEYPELKLQNRYLCFCGGFSHSHFSPELFFLRFDWKTRKFIILSPLSPSKEEIKENFPNPPSLLMTAQVRITTHFLIDDYDYGVPLQQKQKEESEIAETSTQEKGLNTNDGIDVDQIELEPTDSSSQHEGHDWFNNIIMKRWFVTVGSWPQQNYRDTYYERFEDMVSSSSNNLHFSNNNEDDHDNMDRRRLVTRILEPVSPLIFRNVGQMMEATFLASFSAKKKKISVDFFHNLSTTTSFCDLQIHFTNQQIYL